MRLAPLTRFPFLRILAVAAVPAMLVSCKPPPSRVAGGGVADPQVSAACRARADEVYARQNRQDLSRRDQRDSPFSESGNTGITTRGLGDRYRRDSMVAACVAAGGGTSAGASTGPTFTGAASE